MSYSSLGFLVFTTIIGIFYFIVPKKYRWAVLLTASLVFYAINSKFLTVFILLSTVVLFVFGKLIDKQNALYKDQKSKLEKEERKSLKSKTNKKKRAFVTLAILIDAAFLLVIKYSGFFLGTADSILSLFGVDLAVKFSGFILPLGISYYTLTGISYITDVYRGTVSAEKNPLKLLLFLSYFPHIVEGPFSRYGELAPQLFEGSSFDFIRLKSGLMRMLWGLTKKLVLADRAAFLVDAVFKTPADFSGANSLLAVLFYTFQIYAEFSGCMDIVCGISEMLGINLAENFRQPFFSKSIDEFWRRWHITLGAWLRDYIFYPVSLSKSSKKLSGFCRKKLGGYYGTLIPAAYALFFVWFMNGFWHGASWKYVFYGLYYYILMMLGKALKPLFDKIKFNRDSRWFIAFQILRTDIIVFGGMLIFRSHNLKAAWYMFKSIFTSFNFSVFESGSIVKYDNFTTSDLVIVALGITAMLIAGIIKEKGIDLRGKILEHHFLYTWAVLLVMIFVLIIFGIYGGNAVNTFIYGQF